MVNRVGEEGLDAREIMQHVILLLLYANDVVMFSYDVDGMQHLLGALEICCHSPASSIPYAYI